MDSNSTSRRTRALKALRRVPGVGKIVAPLAAARGRAVARATPTGFQFAEADRVDFLSASSWDAVTRGGSRFLQRDYLRFLEAHGPANLHGRYALIFQGPDPVAAVAAQIVDVMGDQLARPQASAESGRLKKTLAPLAARALGRVQQRLLVCGNLLTWGQHGVAFAPGQSPAEIWPAVAEALYRIRRADKLLGDMDLQLVKDVTPNEASGIGSLATYSYRAVETEPNMVLALRPSWRTYDDYLASLDAKHRNAAKSHGRKLAAAGVTVEPVDDLEPHAGRIHELYAQVQGNATVRPVSDPPTFHPELVKLLGADVRCHLARRGSEILGFILTIRDGTTAVGYHIGFDRAAAAEGMPLYLRLLNQTIADGNAFGCTRLSLGRTALDPKSRLGCQAEPMWFWVRHRHQALNLILRQLLELVPHAEAPDRNPFKDEPALGD